MWSELNPIHRVIFVILCSAIWLVLSTSYSCLQQLRITAITVYIYIYIYFSLWRFDPIPGHGLLQRRSAITLIGHTPLGWTPLDGWSNRRIDLHLTTHNTHKRQTSMPPRGIRNHNPNKRAATDPHLKPRGYRDRPLNVQSGPLQNFCKSSTRLNRDIMTADKPFEIGACYWWRKQIEFIDTCYRTVHKILFSIRYIKMGSIKCIKM